MFEKINMWLRKSKKERHEKHEIAAHEWTTLKTLWDECRSKADKKQQEELDKLFEQQPWSSGADTWDNLNRAEQVIASCLDAVRLRAEYDSLLNLARERRLTSLPTFEAHAKTLFSENMDTSDADKDAKLVEKQRAAYKALLYALQSAFVEARFARQLRGRTASRLLYVGLTIVLFVCGGSAGLQYFLKGDAAFQAEAVTLGIVMTMGTLGAFFSRVTAFQAQFATLQYEDITNTYRGKIFFVRLLCGAIGAIILCYILRGKLLEGPMLPNWTIFKDASAVPEGTAIAEWSKLLVWSFLAGFSERLVPDTLDRIGSRRTGQSQDGGP